MHTTLSSWVTVHTGNNKLNVYSSAKDQCKRECSTVRQPIDCTVFSMSKWLGMLSTRQFNAQASLLANEWWIQLLGIMHWWLRTFSAWCALGRLALTRWPMVVQSHHNFLTISISSDRNQETTATHRSSWVWTTTLSKRCKLKSPLS